MPIAAVPIAISHSAERAALLPDELVALFDDRFVRSCELFEEYVARLALQVFETTGLAATCHPSASVAEAVSAARLAAGAAGVPVAWLLGILASRGWVEATPQHDRPTRYTVARPVPHLDPEELVTAQAAHDPACLPSYRIAAIAAEYYPAVLRGDVSGEEALFGAERIGAWFDYFSNANPLYAISNEVGAVAAARALTQRGGAILELGGGLGSGAEALLTHLRRQGQAVPSYRFTEIAPQFLRRAKKRLSAGDAAPGLSFGWLDIDRPFAGAAIKPETYALVYGVNVLHVAHDLEATLAEIRAALVPGGALVMSECVRPFADRPFYVEFVFNLLRSFRDPLLVPAWRPNGGFLTPEQWQLALESNGFRDVRLYPDIASIRDTLPSFVIAALIARKA